MSLYLAALSRGQAEYGDLMKLKTKPLLSMCLKDIEDKNPNFFHSVSSESHWHHKLRLLKNYFNEHKLYLRPQPIRKRNVKDSFYKSVKWIAIRYKMLQLSNGCCECCGTIARKDNPLHVDHIKPRSRYPELQYDLDNLQVLCQLCNLGKGAVDETDWRQPGATPAQVH